MTETYSIKTRHALKEISAVFEVRNLVFSHGKKRILDNINFSLHPREMVALLGKNGAGKTTLMRLMLGLLSPQKGEIFLLGKALAEYGRRSHARFVAYVPQGHTAFFPYKAIDVILLGSLPHDSIWRSVSSLRYEEARSVMKRLGIEGLEKRHYNTLSGGERQSILLARALMQKARILIMDEPETGLDFGQKIRLYDIFHQLVDDGYTLFITSHDPLWVKKEFTRTMVLAHQALQADGSPHFVLTDEYINKIYNISSLTR